MVAFMHTGTRLTAGYRYTTLGDATRTCVRERKAALIEQNHTGGVVIDFVCFVGAYPRVIGRRNGKHWAA